MAASVRRKRDDGQLVLELARGATIRDAAAATGFSEKTVSRRLETATFRRRVSQARGEMLATASGRMADGMAAAADTLRALLLAKSEAIRLGAARALLELGVKLRESVELEARISALEGRK